MKYSRYTYTQLVTMNPMAIVLLMIPKAASPHVMFSCHVTLSAWPEYCRKPSDHLQWTDVLHVLVNKVSATYLTYMDDPRDLRHVLYM
jgi:TRAP-type uncharacterized transport system fused permease subunit